VVYVFLTLVSLFIFKPPNPGSSHRTRGRGTKKRYRDEKKGKGNSSKGRKKATKKETVIVVEEPALLH